MITISDKPSHRADPEDRPDVLPAWFEDREIQERVARLIAKGAAALVKPLPTSS